MSLLNAQSINNNFFSKKKNLKHFMNLYIYRYQFTTITSRSTSYFLFFFWLFFFFFGESLLMLIFNFTTPVDTISSTSFFLVKQHIIFLTDSLSNKLVSSINFYIYLLTTLSLMYLVNLNYISNYSYFKQSTVNMIVPMVLILLIL